MKQYKFNDAHYGTHNLIAEEVGCGEDILDVGCNKGYLKNLSKENNFYGIDFDESDLRLAKKNGYVEVYRVDLNKYEEFYSNKKFGAIIFGDVLEHLMYPPEVLEYFIKNYLKDNGRIIISLPNVANIIVRFNLLLGKFNYTDSGILDKTHLHLYTTKTAISLIRCAGLKIIKRKFSSNIFGFIIKKIPLLGDLLGFNLIFVCQRKY